MNNNISREKVKEAEDQDKFMLNDITEMLRTKSEARDNLIPVLQAIQKKHSYLSKEAIKLVAEHFDISPSEVYGVATFYNQFRFIPPGKHQIKVCLGTACHVRGGDIILENFERRLVIKCGETTPDREFSIERVACVGCCAQAPVAIMDQQIQGKMAPSKVEGFLMGIRIEKEKEDRKRQNK